MKSLFWWGLAANVTMIGCCAYYQRRNALRWQRTLEETTRKPREREERFQEALRRGDHAALLALGVE